MSVASNINVHSDKFVLHFSHSLLLAVLFVASSGNVYGEITNLSAAINKAGQQRMLTQRILSSYAMIGINVMAETSRQQLDDAIVLYERQLAELQAYSPNAKTTKTIRQLKQLWGPYKRLMKKPVSRENIKELYDANEKLLAVSHQLVLQLEEISGTSHARLVNVSGRQRMLSQRLTKFYMLKSWGIDSPEYNSESEQARVEFDAAMIELIQAPENTPEIKQALSKAKSQWDLFQYGLERNKKTLVPLIVATTSEQLSASMTHITGLYEALSTQMTLATNKGK